MTHGMSLLSDKLSCSVDIIPNATHKAESRPGTLPVATLAENTHKHQNSILDALDPSTSRLFKLLYKYKIDEKFRGQHLSRHKKAKKLLKKVQKLKIYPELLQCLEEDNEHMGHEYLACLLRGEEYGGPEVIKQSKILCERLVEKATALDVKELQPYLIQNKLITIDEAEELSRHTKQNQANLLLTILKTKGPTAHYILTHQCLAKEPFHKDLYTFLTDSKPRDIPRSPDRLKPPKAIRTSSYYQSIKLVRQYQQMDKDKSQEANKLCLEVVNSENKPLEEKIAFLLESCVSHIVSDQLDLIEDIVEQAEDMCKTLDRKYTNVDCLRARCGWIMAWMYKNKKTMIKLSNTFTPVWGCFFFTFITRKKLFFLTIATDKFF